MPRMRGAARVLRRMAYGLPLSTAGTAVGSISSCFLSRPRIMPLVIPQIGQRGGVALIGETLLQLLHSK